ncbi:hypothetical protein [Nocardia sp. NPDC051832]|uniref:hypothetical protein n=1 Tax=Nocardia sp. NPDC051832 TaxID=3155673 RepID=UPI003426A5E9
MFTSTVPVRFTAAALAPLAAAAVFATPAQAAVTNLTVSTVPTSGSSEGYGIGCTYDVVVQVDGPSVVTLTVHGPQGAPLSQTDHAPGAARWVLKWTPRVTGRFELVAEDDHGTRLTRTVDVRNSVFMGKTCVPLPV